VKDRQVQPRADQQAQGAAAHRSLPDAWAQRADEIPDRLSARATLLLVVLGFGCAFAIEALVTGRQFTGEPAAMRSALAEVTDADGPVAQPRLRPVGPVPALREPQRPRRRQARAHRPQRRVRKVVKAAPRVQRSPVLPAATVQPTPTTTPRYIPPAAPRPPAAESPPAAPQPKPKPAPTSAPPDSGEFDTTGESP
jgi:hypothetical protein